MFWSSVATEAIASIPCFLCKLLPSLDLEAVPRVHTGWKFAIPPFPRLESDPDRGSRLKDTLEKWNGFSAALLVLWVGGVLLCCVEGCNSLSTFEIPPAFVRTRVWALSGCLPTGFLPKS